MKRKRRPSMTTIVVVGLSKRELAELMRLAMAIPSKHPVAIAVTKRSR